MDVGLIFERLRQAIGIKTDTELALRMGYTEKSKSTITRWRQRNKLTSKLEQGIRRVCEQHGVNIHWVLTGEGEMKETPKGGDAQMIDAKDLMRLFEKVIDQNRDVLDQNINETRIMIGKVDALLAERKSDQGQQMDVLTKLAKSVDALSDEVRRLRDGTSPPQDDKGRSLSKKAG